MLGKGNSPKFLGEQNLLYLADAAIYMWLHWLLQYLLQTNQEVEVEIFQVQKKSDVPT